MLDTKTKQTKTCYQNIHTTPLKPCIKSVNKDLEDTQQTTYQQKSNNLTKGEIITQAHEKR